MNSLDHFAILLGALTVAFAGIVARDWHRSRDVLYPTLYVAPILFVLYVIFPLVLWRESETLFLYYGGGPAPLCWYALQTLVFAVCFTAGCSSGARPLRFGHAQPRYRADAALRGMGCLLALVGCVTFFGAVLQAGGFAVVYGGANAGVYIESGWISELRNVGLAAAPLIMLSRRGRGMRAGDWLLVAVAVLPLLVQGLLGARRGPTFLAICIVVVGYLALFRPKVRLLSFLAGGVLLGLLLLFLVANRDNIYVGSREVGTRSVTSALTDFKGNEFIYGLSFVRYIDSGAAPFYGRRVLGHMLGRMAPKSIWPDAYQDISQALDMPDVDYRINAGAPLLRMESVLGFLPPNGAAPGIVGELYLEFGPYGLPVAAFLLGALYGTLWRMSAQRGDLRHVALYLMLVALSIYLVTQSLEAWLYRLLLFGLPLWLLTGLLDRAGERRAWRQG